MSSTDPIRNGIRRLFRLALHRHADAAPDADAELGAVIDARIEYLVARGASPDAARAEAMRHLGASPDNARDAVRRSAEQRERSLRWRAWFGDMTSDVRYAIRTLRRTPALGGAAVLTLALAIGANTAIFSAVSAVILRPLPYTDPDRLVFVGEENPDFGWHLQDAAPANLLDWKEQVHEFADVAGYFSFSGDRTLTGYGDPKTLSVATVTGNFFDVLGVRPALGTALRPADTGSNGPPTVVVLSHRAWRNFLGADTAVVGHSVQINGRAIQVLGVLPEGFAVPGLDADAWVPVSWNPADRSQPWFRRAHFVRAVARLTPGATIERADASLQVVVRRLQQDYPATNTHMGAQLAPLHDVLIGKARLPLLVMLGAVGVLLLIACANVANLLLVRAASRARESAVRLALGASRGRLVRQALVESAVLAFTGGAAGLLLGWWGTRALVALQPRAMLPVGDVGVNRMVLGYVAVVTCLSAVFFGVAPAMWSGRRSPAEVLKDEGRASSGGAHTRRWGEALLVGQVALALSLTMGAGLLVRSYMQLRRVHPGFDPFGVLAVRISLPGTAFDTSTKVAAFYSELEQRAARIPGVAGAAVVTQPPLTTDPWSSTMAIAGHPPLSRGSQVVHRSLSPGLSDGDARPGPPRTHVHAGRPAEYDARAARQRDTGQTILSRCRSVGSARGVRSGARQREHLVHDRRRGGRRAPGRHRPGSVAGVPRPQRAESDDADDVARARITRHRAAVARARRSRHRA